VTLTESGAVVVVVAFFFATVVGVDFLLAVPAMVVVVASSVVVDSMVVVVSTIESTTADESFPRPTESPATKVTGRRTTTARIRSVRFEIRKVMWSSLIE